MTALLNRNWSKDISVIYICIFCILARSGNLCVHLSPNYYYYYYYYYYY